MAILGILWGRGSLDEISFMAFIVAAFFFASAGASAAYLTVSEIFPMETRALAIAFFYSIGTAAGGIVGPLMFGYFIDSGNRDLVIAGFFIGAAIMALGGVAEVLFGIAAERRSLEAIARPLTAIKHEAATVRERARERAGELRHGRADSEADDESGAAAT